MAKRAHQAPVAHSAEREAFGRRLTELLERSKMSIGDIQNALGVSYEMARRYVRGIAVPEYETRVRLAKLMNVSLAWLETGALESLPAARPDGHTVRLLTVEEAANFEKSVVTKAGTVVSAASGDFAMTISDDAMMATLDGARALLPGDYVVVSAKTAALPGDYVVARHESGKGGALLRRLVVESMRENDWKLVANNPNYPIIKPDDGYKIIGPVVQLCILRHR